MNYYKLLFRLISRGFACSYSKAKSWVHINIIIIEPTSVYLRHIICNMLFCSRKKLNIGTKWVLYIKQSNLFTYSKTYLTPSLYAWLFNKLVFFSTKFVGKKDFHEFQRISYSKRVKPYVSYFLVFLSQSLWDQC